MKKQFTFLAVALGLTLSSTRADCVHVINRAGIDGATLEQTIDFCNQHLPFRLRATTAAPLVLEKDESPDIEQLVSDSACTVNILLVEEMKGSPAHQAIDYDRHAALVNVAPLRTDDDRLFRWRIERMIMRSVAYLFGLRPAPDPHCVTRHYTSIEDLDTMGRNFTPPYNDIIRRRAGELDIALDFPEIDPAHTKGPAPATDTPAP